MIGWMVDGGIEVRLGDKVNGFVAGETFALVAGIGPWLQQAIAHTWAGVLATDSGRRDQKPAPTQIYSSRWMDF